MLTLGLLSFSACSYVPCAIGGSACNQVAASPDAGNNVGVKQVEDSHTDYAHHPHTVMKHVKHHVAKHLAKHHAEHHAKHHVVAKPVVSHTAADAPKAVSPTADAPKPGDKPVPLDTKK